MLERVPAEAALPFLSTTAIVVTLLVAGSVEPVFVEPAVTVEADADRPDPTETSASLSVVPVDARLSSTSDVAEVVGNAAGATVQRLGGQGDFSAVSIRGSTLKQVQVYLDGVPLNPDGVSIVNLSELPLQAFSRVEIYRGNAPLDFGATPMGGVVNLVTRDVGGKNASVALSGGSYHTASIHGWAATAGLLGSRPLDLLVLLDTFASRGDFSYFDNSGTESELFDDHLRKRVNNDKVQFNAHVRWRLHAGRATLTVMDRILWREAGVPGYAVAPALSARLETLSNLWVADIAPVQTAWTPRGRVWGRWRQDVFSDPENEVGLGAGTELSRTSNLGVRLHASRLLAPPLLLELSGEARRDGFNAIDLDTGLENGPMVRHAITLSAGSVASVRHGRVLLSPAVQVPVLDNRDLWEQAGSAISGGDNAETAPTPAIAWGINPRLGLLVRPHPSLAIKANAGRYLRPPDPTELFGDRGYITGNPRLEPEQGWQGDAGARWEGAAGMHVTGSASVTGFWNASRNLIVFIQNSQRTMLAVNVGRARVQGVESTISLAVAEVVTLDTGATWTRAVNLSDIPDQYGKALPRTPPWLVFARTTLLVRSTFRLGYLFQFAAANYWDTPNIERSAPRTIHNLYLDWRPRSGRLSVALSVDNVFDRIVEIVPRDNLTDADTALVVRAVTDFVGYPLPGRWITATVRARF